MNYNDLLKIEIPLADVIGEVNENIKKLNESKDENYIQLLNELNQALNDAHSKLVELQVKLVRKNIGTNKNPLENEN